MQHRRGRRASAMDPINLFTDAQCLLGIEGEGG
jgi:hypothetical protein